MRMPLIPENCRIGEEACQASARDLPGRRNRPRRRLDDWPAVDPQAGRGRSRQGRRRDCEGDRTWGGVRELSALLDQPHTADVRALKASQFHVADAAAY